MFRFFAKHKILSVIAILIIIVGVLALRNMPNEDLIRKLQDTGMQVRPILGEELKIKREYFASHSSFIFLIMSKAIASPTIKKETYKIAFGGPSAAKEAVDKMPEEEIGFVLEVDGVLIEISRFPVERMPVAVAAMMTALKQKDLIRAQCGQAEYANRMTCSEIIYIPKRNHLIAVSNIKDLIEIYDDSGKRVARDYEPVPESNFQKVIKQLERL